MKGVECTEGGHCTRLVKKELGIWGPSDTIPEGYCSMGDVAVQGYTYPKIRHHVAHAIKPGALVKPIAFFEEWDDTGSGTGTPLVIRSSH